MHTPRHATRARPQLEQYDGPLAEQYRRALLMDVTDLALEGDDERALPVGMTNANKRDVLRQKCVDHLLGGGRRAALEALAHGLASAPTVWAHVRAHVHTGAELRLLLLDGLGRARTDAAALEEARARQAAVAEMVRTLGRGHAFRCPNGHLYFIGECGGAMQQGRCVECGAPVGGGQHRLRADNAHDGAVDGSAAPAWPPRG